MERFLKQLSVFLLIIIAAFALNAPKADAATVSAKANVEGNNGHWIAQNGHLSFNISGLPKTGEYFLKMPTRCHYSFTLDGQKYTVVAGSYYVKNGFLAAVPADKTMALDYWVVDNTFKAKKNGVAIVTVKHTIPKADRLLGSKLLSVGKGTKYPLCRNVVGKEIVYVHNINLYTGYTLKDNKMYRVASGIIKEAYTGSVTSYYDYAANAMRRQAVTGYEKGVPANGWVTAGTGVCGVFKNGVLDKSRNYWCKNPDNDKWYYFTNGKIYKTGKKGPANKKLKSTGLNYWGHGKASPGSFRYYLDKDGSLITNVFKADPSWYKKKMRIYVNAKSGIDNVTFMGYIKGSGFCVPLRTIVTTCSKKNSVLKKQVRGSKGSGKWKLGRTHRSRYRWYVFRKDGNKFYYQYATSIIGSGALFHSPRFLRKSIHTLYKPHFNAMGKKNITTKCVRLQVANALMVYNISKKCKSYNYVTFVRKGRGSKNAHLPFGITELRDSIGTKTWKKNYDPSDPAI